MKPWTVTFGAKAVAFIAGVLLVAALAACCLGFAFLAGNNVYDGSEFSQTDLCDQVSLKEAHSIASLYYDFGQDADWASILGESVINYGFQIYSEQDPSMLLSQYHLPENVSNLNIYHFTDISVWIHVSTSIQPGDAYYAPFRLFQFLQRWQYGLIAITVLLLLLFILDSIFLCCIAGRHPGKEQPEKNVLDKIPLEIYALGVGLMAMLPFSLYVIWNDFTLYFEVILICLISGYEAFCLYSILLTLATRVKCGRWWQGTLVFGIFHLFAVFFRWVWSGLTSVFRSLPLVWKTVLLFLGAMLVDLLLTLALAGGGGLIPFALLLSFNAFLLAMLCRLSLNLRAIASTTSAIAAGRNDQKLSLQGMDGELKNIAEGLNSVSDGMAIAVENSLKSERMKTELITNVSHDIKTPLTSIVNYVDLLGKLELPAQALEYLDVLARQSRRLKKLTEDIVEASKASTGNLPVQIQPTNLCELVSQAVGEYEDLLEKNQLLPVIGLPEQPLYVLADGRLLWRVIDNLLSNACKYAQSGTRVYIDVAAGREKSTLTIKNISRSALNINVDELMERFVRGDTARTTEGSGLGLNIAQSLMRLQNGDILLSIDGDLFKATLLLPLADSSQDFQYDSCLVNN